MQAVQADCVIVVGDFNLDNTKLVALVGQSAEYNDTFDVVKIDNEIAKHRVDGVIFSRNTVVVEALLWKFKNVKDPIIDHATVMLEFVVGGQRMSLISQNLSGRN
jgi:hypothetical protein